MNRSFHSLSQYLEAFSPKDYGTNHPFALEIAYKPAGIELIPRKDEHFQDTIKKLKKIGNVTHRDDGTWIVSNKKEQEVPRQFYWIGLKSSRNTEFRNLWALMHLALKSNDHSVTAKEIATLTDTNISTITEWLNKQAGQNMAVNRGDSFFVEPCNESLVLQKLWTAAPQPIDEIVMDYLCNNYEPMKTEVCNDISGELGLSKSRVYQSLQEFEKGSFVKVTSIKREGKKGPASDQLTVCCGNCFFAFASKEDCFNFEVENLYYYLEKSWGKKLKEEEKKDLKNFVETISEGPRFMRKLNSILQHLEQIKKEANEEEHLQEAILFLQSKFGLSIGLPTN